jgi:hypothetical protein
MIHEDLAQYKGQMFGSEEGKVKSKLLVPALLNSFLPGGTVNSKLPLDIFTISVARFIDMKALLALYVTTNLYIKLFISLWKIHEQH